MPENPHQQSSRSAFEQYLRSNKLRITPERLAIAEAATRVGRLYTADDLHRLLDADGYHVSRATVYNTLHTLAEASIVRTHTFDSSCVHYEYIKASSATTRILLICDKCGRVKETKDPELTRMLKSRRYSTFQTSHSSVYVYGTCGRCRRKKQTAAHKTTEKNKTT